MSSQKASGDQTHPLLTGLAYGESPRWHEDRLWFSHWGTGEVVAVDPHGNSEVVAHVPAVIPFSIDWLPDGRMLITSGRELLRIELDGSLATHVDLGGISKHGWNEIVVDGRGNTYVNNICGICIDAEGAVWSPAMKACVRVREGGEVMERIELDRFCFACMLGGADRRTLFILAADWQGPERMLDGPRTGRVLTVEAPAPVGYP